jgi:hypothetical protein
LFAPDDQTQSEDTTPQRAKRATKRLESYRRGQVQLTDV